jgi:hypothetical protein
MEPVAGRDWALRIPFLVAAGATFLLFLYALHRLNSTRIAEARQMSPSADSGETSVESSVDET